jgi:hypothetical protein
VYMAAEACNATLLLFLHLACESSTGLGDSNISTVLALVETVTGLIRLFSLSGSLYIIMECTPRYFGVRARSALVHTIFKKIRAVRPGSYRAYPATMIIKLSRLP